MKAGRDVVAIVGAGRLAQAMARAWARARGLRVVVAARRPKAASRWVKDVRGAVLAPIDEAVAAASIVLLAVPDRSIAPLARAIVPLRDSWRGVVVLHGAGAYGPELLSALASRGAATGVLHPLAVLAADGAPPFEGSFARIEGSASAGAAARRLAKLAGCVPLPGPGLDTARVRRAYHAAASLASNDVVALLAASHRLLVALGIPAPAAWRAVVSLAEGAVSAAGRHGAAGGLTGPVVRNDAGTLRGQLAALGSHDPEAREAHRALSSILVGVAVRSGRLARKDGADLKRRLARGRGGPRTV